MSKFPAPQQPRRSPVESPSPLSAPERLEGRDLPSTFLNVVSVPGYTPSTGATNYDQISFTFNGQAMSFGGVQLGVKVGTSSNIPVGSTPDFYAFCVDLNHSTNFNSPYQVAPTAVTNASLPNGAALAYLYDTFNTSVGNPLSKNNAAGLQLALWEKEYGKAFSLTSVQDLGNSGADVTSSVQAIANKYLSSIPCSPTTQATYYDASLGGTVTNGEQSLIGPPTCQPTSCHPTPQPSTPQPCNAQPLPTPGSWCDWITGGLCQTSTHPSSGTGQSNNNCNTGSQLEQPLDCLLGALGAFCGSSQGSSQGSSGSSNNCNTGSQPEQPLECLLGSLGASCGSSQGSSHVSSGSSCH